MYVTFIDANHCPSSVVILFETANGKVSLNFLSSDFFFQNFHSVSELSYVMSGKERIFLEVARVLRKKIYVGAVKLRLLTCRGLPEEDMQWLTCNEHESHIHVVPLWSIANFKRMNMISKHYHVRAAIYVWFLWQLIAFILWRLISTWSKEK